MVYQVGDRLRVRAGYLTLGGSRNSLIGQYHRHDGFVLEPRLSF